MSETDAECGTRTRRPRARSSRTRLTTAQLIRAALAEDIGSGDITSRLIVHTSQCATARLVARSNGVLAGISICRQVFYAVDHSVLLKRHLEDGARFRAGQTLATIVGHARSLLAAERTALNFLQRLSGIATITRRFVDALSGTKAAILDTRKTTPGWRALEKYAVRCGGGTNHRTGLFDMILIKDNHIAVAGSVTEALRRSRGHMLPREVEVRSLTELQEALAAGARRVMLDNMTVSQMRQAVALTRRRAKLEASGGITLENVRRIAETGVDFISVGALTHSVPAADIALDFLPG
jgi:nicotinate-nucleotide pyrophosphorylase (carboxylating)